MIHAKPANLTIPESTRPFADAVSLEISSDDGMFHGNVDHYLSCGASALNVITSIVQLAGIGAPERILDFGAGAGRVTRWLRAAFPAASIEACDIREGDVAFCRERLGVRAWRSGVEIETLQAPNTYDLIWVGSVLTHLSADDAVRITRRWLEWTNPGGLVIATTHGRTAVEFAETGFLTYIEPERWACVMEDYRTTGYGYADYAHVRGYGISLTAPSWIARFVESWPGVRLVALGERAWDGHQDVVALQKLR